MVIVWNDIEYSIDTNIDTNLSQSIKIVKFSLDTSLYNSFLMFFKFLYKINDFIILVQTNEPDAPIFGHSNYFNQNT